MFIHCAGFPGIRNSHAVLEIVNSVVNDSSGETHGEGLRQCRLSCVMSKLVGAGSPTRSNGAEVASQLAQRPPVARIASKLRLTAFLYIGFISALSLFCYKYPLSDDFDRYMYEAIVRSRHQSLDAVYDIVKHESARAEASTILDSPEHLARLQPLYAIRPGYIRLIAFLSDRGIGVQRAINLISAGSLFGIGVIIFLWTGRAVASALLLASAPILILGRMGTPDALSALLVLLGLWAITKGSLYGLAPLMLSLPIRTDNALLIVMVLVWLLYSQRLSWKFATVLAALALGSVLVINRLAHSYGWIVLFRWSFLGGYRSPADIPSHLAIREYLSVLVQSLEHLFSYVTIWLLLGLAAWLWSRRLRPLLAVVSLTIAVHFLMYPSPEGRYFIWAYMVAGVAFIESVMGKADGFETSI